MLQRYRQLLGTIGLSLYSIANTVAAANETVVWPEGKELYIFLPLEVVAVFEKGPKEPGFCFRPGWIVRWPCTTG